MKIVKEMLGTAVAIGVTYVVLILVVILSVSFVLLEVLLKLLMSLITLLNAKTTIVADWILETCSRFATAVITSKLWKSAIVVEDFLIAMRKKLKRKNLV